MIDVKALAQQAGFEFDEETKYERAQLLNRARHDEAAFERFAALVLESAAVTCDELWQEDGTALQCRDAIRAMKPKGDV